MNHSTPPPENISNSKKKFHTEINAHDVQGNMEPSPHVDLLFLKLQNNMSQRITAGESGLVPQKPMPNLHYIDSETLNRVQC